MAAKAEYLRHFFLDQIVDNDLGTVEHIARRHRLSPYRFHNGRRSEDETRSRFYIDSRRRVRKYHAAIKKGLSHSRIHRELKGTSLPALGGDHRWTAIPDEQY